MMASAQTQPWNGHLIGQPRLSPKVFAWVVLVHGAVLAGLVSLRVDPVVLPQTTLMVDVLSETEAEPKPEQPPAKPVTTLPQPKPVAKQEQPKAAAPAPVLAVDAATPTAPAEVQKVTEPEPLPPIQAPPAPPAPVAVAAPTAPRVDANYLDNPKPVYPPLSRKAGEQGKVVLRVYVEASGAASKVEIATSAGYERLDRSAANAVARWKFIPARQGTTAVAAWVLVPINFSLEE